MEVKTPEEELEEYGILYSDISIPIEYADDEYLIPLTEEEIDELGLKNKISKLNPDNIPLVEERVKQIGQLKPGDIVLGIPVNKKYLGKHEIYVIRNTGKEVLGHCLSSDVNKSNIISKKAKNACNIYIDNRSTIFGNTVSTSQNIPGYINIKDTFRIEVLRDRKHNNTFRKIGHCKQDFISAINTCHRKWLNDEDTSKLAWMNGELVNMEDELK